MTPKGEPNKSKRHTPKNIENAKKRNRVTPKEGNPRAITNTQRRPEYYKGSSVAVSQQKKTKGTENTRTKLNDA